MSTTLSDIFKEEKVPSDLAAELSRILTIHSFACIAPSAEQLEDSIKEAVPGTLHALMNPVCIACLKAAYHRCLTSLVSVAASPPPSAPAPASSLTASSTWTDTFPAKLGHEKVSALKTKFEADYPSEILDHSTMPSSRLLATVNKQCQEKHYSYVAWKHRVSEEKLDDMHSNRPRKIARFDDFIFDEVPFREIPESGISQMFLLHLLDLLAFAFCLLEAAHLSSFRLGTQDFVHRMYMKCNWLIKKPGDAFAIWPTLVGALTMPSMKWCRTDGPKWCISFMEAGVQKQMCKRWNLRSHLHFIGGDFANPAGYISGGNDEVEANTLNYTVTLGNFTGGGLLLESESGDHSHFVAEMNRNLRFALVDARDQPLAFDGTLWHGTAPFQGDRWVITAYTCRNLDKLRETDVQALRAWGFPLPKCDALPTAEVASLQPPESTSLPSKFCLWLGSIAQVDKEKLSLQSVPLITVPDLQDGTLRHQVIRCSADGVFSTIFIRFSGEWSAAHNIWVLQLCKLAFSCGTTVHLDISAWDNCWYDPLFIHCVATGFRHVVQIPPCAFQGKAGDIPYTTPLIEAFGKLFISTDGATGVPGATFSVQHAWDSIPGKNRQGCHAGAQSRLLSPKEESLLSAEDIARVQSIFGNWLQEQTGNSVDWSIPPDQPYCLHAFSALSSALHDCDISLFGALLQGVPTGFKQDIPLSGCFAPSGRAVEEDSLSIAMENWQGAEADPLLLEELVQVEVDSGWLRCIDSLEDARKIWPNVAVGKLNIVHSAGLLGIRVGPKLFFYKVHSKKELLNCNLGDKDIWLRISDP
ncbi:unnamed protein product, partial [Symbiodinium necroappetens]